MTGVESRYFLRINGHPLYEVPREDIQGIVETTAEMITDYYQDAKTRVAADPGLKWYMVDFVALFIRHIVNLAEEGYFKE